MVCAAGMSSSSFVVKIRNEIKNQGLLDLKIGSCASNQIDKYIDQTDMILLTPQLTYYNDELKKKYPNVKIKTIPTMVYGKQDSESVIKLILSLDEEQTSENKQEKLINILGVTQ